MKRTILFVFLFFCFSLIVISATQDRHQIMLSASTKNAAKTKKPKSIFIAPIDVIVDGTLLTLSFDKALDAQITIRSSQDGAVVYTNVLTTQPFAVLPISLNDCTSGEYEIEFAYGDTILTGAFAID